MRHAKNLSTSITVSATQQVIAFCIALLHQCYQTEDALRAIAAYYHYDLVKQQR